MGGTPKTAAQETPALDHITLQSSAYGQPIPIVYGTFRVPGLVIWYDEFKATRHEQSQEVGKGGSADVKSVTYTYSACVQMALCEGPIVSFGRVWKDKDVYVATYAAGFEASDVGPRSNPTPWAHLTSAHSAKALGYGGTAWVAAAALDLKNAQLGNHTFEVRGFNGTHTHTYTDPRGASQTAYDAHPKDIITDLLTSTEYGAGWDSSRIVVALGADGTAGSSYENYCHAVGFYLSLALTEQSTALDVINGIAESTNSALVWSQGKLKVLPYGDTTATGNGFTFTPDTTVAYALGVDDYVTNGADDPIQVERTNLQDTYNSFPVEYSDRAQDYKVTVAEDPDQADGEAYGLRRASPVNLHYICRPEIATAVSRLKAQRSVWIRNTYKFRLPQRYVLLEPMDLVSLTEPRLGLDAHVVRITEITESEEEGTFEIVAEEWPFGTGTHTLYTAQVGDGTAVNFSADPGNAYAPEGFVPTLQLSAGALQFWMVTSGGTNWGGADVYVSDDATTYKFAGTAYRARFGVTVGAITSSSTTISVDLTASAGTLISTTAAGAADDLTAIWIDGEVISYQTATLTSAYNYTLTGCLRGRQSTTAAAHSSGAACIRLDEGVFKFPLTYARLGATVYVKLASFNTLGGAKQDISGLSAYTFAIPAAPAILPTPSGVTISISGTEPP